VSASVNLPLHHKVQTFSSGTGSPGWCRKKGHKTVVVMTDTRLTASFPWQPGSASTRKPKPISILLKREMIGWKQHQMHHMKIICTSRQTNNHSSTSSLRLNALPDAQPTVSKHWRQSDNKLWCNIICFWFGNDSITSQSNTRKCITFSAGKYSINSTTEVDDGYITTVASSTKVARHDVQLLLYSRCVLYMNVTWCRQLCGCPHTQYGQISMWDCVQHQLFRYDLQVTKNLQTFLTKIPQSHHNVTTEKYVTHPRMLSSLANASEMRQKWDNLPAGSPAAAEQSHALI